MSGGNGNANADGGFSFPKGPTMPKITTGAKRGNGICHDDSGPTVKATTLDELHSLQKKRSAPTTPINQGPAAAAFAAAAEEERQKIQLQSIRSTILTCIYSHIGNLDYLDVSIICSAFTKNYKKCLISN